MKYIFHILVIAIVSLAPVADMKLLSSFAQHDNSRHLEFEPNRVQMTPKLNPVPAWLDSTRPDTTISREFIEAASDSSWWRRNLKNRAFGVGERLEFSVKYGRLPAGTAILEIPDTITQDGHLCYRVKSSANSNDVVSVFYKVRDNIETIIDASGIFPRKFVKRLREGGYKKDQMTIFDQKMHLAITNSDTVATYAFVQDPLSSLYFLRTQELVPGKDLFVDNHTDKKNYPLKVIVHKKETIKVPAGKFDCLMIEPVMRAEGIFKARGRIWIWVTDDQYKMPVMMKSEVFFLGSVSAQLSSYTRGRIEEAWHE